MVINNIVLEEKHLYMQVLLNAESIKKQEELNIINDEKKEKQLNEVNAIWLNAFTGLIREKLDYDYIKTSDGDMIRLTIDNIQFDCKTDDLKKTMGEDYDKFVSNTHNLIYMGDNVTFVSETAPVKTQEKSQKEIELEKEIIKLKERAQRQKEQYLKEVNYDSMTGLKNKKAFNEDISELKDECFFISIDANELKRTNDTYGHVYGDKLLTGIANNIKKIFGECSYRTGGDEFYVIDAKSDEEQIIEKLNALKENLSSHSESGMTFSISAGYAYCNKGAKETEKQDAIEEADRQMYKDKQAYHELHYYPDSRLGQRAEDIDSSGIPIAKEATQTAHSVLIPVEVEEEPEEEIIFDDINNKTDNNKQVDSQLERIKEQDKISDTPDNSKQSKAKKRKELNKEPKITKEIDLNNKLIEEPSIKKDPYNYGFDKYKDVSTFVYDTYEATILAPGSSNGESFKALIAPLKMYTDNNHPEIMCMLVNKFGEIRRYVSTPMSPTLKIQFEEYELIIRGMFIDGKFTSKILTSGSTLAMGFSINVNTFVPQRSTNLELTNYGHLVFEQDDCIFHVVPMSKVNDQNGVAPCFICIEKPDENRDLVSTNENAITLYENDGVSYQILTYWQNNLLCADIL